MDGWTIARSVIVVAGGLWLAVGVVCASDSPPGGFGTLMLLFLLGFPTAIAWVIYSLAWPGVFRSWRRCLLWLTVPAAPVVVAVCLQTGLPMAARVLMSESALREYVEADDLQKPLAFRIAQPDRVGLLNVCWVDRRETAVLFVTGFDMFETGGVAYAPDGPPTRGDGSPLNVTHLYGPWYRFVVITD